jgi:putative flippase GtrA
MSGLGAGLVRWGKFNLVGAMGSVVQLGVLAAFSRGAQGHYLWATAAAIEVTLLHNFCWHLRFTWRERLGDGASLWRRMVRFQATNGVVSMVGNLGLMRVLVSGVGMPVVASNGIAIVCCSAVNFAAAEWWSFAAANDTPSCHDKTVSRMGHPSTTAGPSLRSG